MKRVIFISVAFLLILGLILTGCGPSATTPTTKPPAATTSAAPATTAPKTTAAPTTSAAPKTTAPATSAAPAKQIVLRVADFTQPGQLENVVEKYWGDELMKRTNNAVKVEYYFNETLAKQKELLTAVSTGMSDVSIVYGCFHQQQVPIIFVHRTPGMPTTDHWTAVWAYDNLLKEEATKAELQKNNLIGMFGFGHTGDYLFSTKPIKTFDDIKGMKFASSGLYSAAFKAWGGEAVEIASPEIYEGMKRGMINACNKPLTQMITMNMYEVSPFLMTPKIGFTMLAVTMNLNTWNNKLTPEIQKIITELNKEMPRKAVELGARDDVRDLDAIKTKPVTVTTLSAADMAKLNSSVAFVWDQWADDLNKRGLPGTDLKNKYLGWMKQGPPK